MRNPTGAAELPLGPKTSVTPKIIPKKVFVYLQKEPQLGFKEPHVVLEPHDADPWRRSYNQIIMFSLSPVRSSPVRKLKTVYTKLVKIYKSL